MHFFYGDNLQPRFQSDREHEEKEIKISTCLAIPIPSVDGSETSYPKLSAFSIPVNRDFQTGQTPGRDFNRA
jgi:hypothetical protein